MLDKEMDLICICCPRGCHLHVAKDLSVSGNFCPRGATYAKQEVLSPERVLTSTVAVKGGSLPLCSVKSARPIPKSLLFKAMEEVNAILAEAPISLGDVLIEDLAGSGVPLIATMDVK